MSGPRLLVSPPSVVPRPYGLLSVVQRRFDEADAHWRNGVTYEVTCGVGGRTFSAYCAAASGDPGAKVANVEIEQRGATPVTPYAEVVCSLPGYTIEEQRRRAVDSLLRIEEAQLEYAFWTGDSDSESSNGAVYPHLAANSEVLDETTWASGPVTPIVLQPAATSVTGAALDAVEALGLLEQELAECLQGQGVIHMTVAVADLLGSTGLLKPAGNQLKTLLGNLVAVGAGYPGTSPAGADTPGVHWMYATGQVFAYRSASEIIGDFRETIDLATNTQSTIAERTYVLGFGCCLLAIPVSLSGDPFGEG